MSFLDLPFFVFLPLVFLIYWHVFKNSYKAQNILLLFASYVFYAWWDWRFLFLIAASTLVDFICAREIEKTNKINSRKLLLWLSIIVNIGILGFFKYFNFFIDSAETLVQSIGFSWDVSNLNIILPVGISFYTFQSMSYTIDVYNKKIKCSDSLVQFATYVAFFPQLVAGPIERASHLLPQFSKRRNVNYQDLSDGARQILWGFFKKVVIADNCAMLVTDTYGDLSFYDHSGITLWVTMFYFSIQIYCDFSGYSDIAIGLAKWFGIRINTNFKTPYFSKNIAEFWRNWHISLSTWFRDYVYVPLGGNKGSKRIWVRNILVVFLVSGLWHGADIKFIIWGAIHGLLYLGYTLFSDKWKWELPNWLAVSITFIAVTIAWTFFRARDVLQAWDMIYYSFIHLFKHPGIYKSHVFALPNLYILILIFFEMKYRREKYQFKIGHWPHTIRWLSYAIMLLLVVYNLVLVEAQEFIYFQF